MPDTTPPTVTANPSQGSPLAPTTPIQVTVQDNVGLAQLLLVASFETSNTRELIWDDANGFNGFYLGSANTVASVIVGEAQVGWTFTILRDGGWPDTVDLQVFAVDTSGNVIDG